MLKFDADKFPYNLLNNGLMGYFAYFIFAFILAGIILLIITWLLSLFNFRAFTSVWDMAILDVIVAFFNTFSAIIRINKLKNN